MQSGADINPNLLSLILHHSTTSNNMNILNTPISSRKQRVKLKQDAAGTLKIPTGYKQKSGRLRPAKYISFYDFAVPVPTTMFKSPPTSSAFFSVYNMTKSKLEYHAYCENIHRYLTDVFAVYMGHTASCGVRVPVDVVKQNSRRPANAGLTVFQLVNKLVCSKGIGEVLGRQLLTTVVREIPFCSIKFPLWEFFKVTLESRRRAQNRNIETYESAIVGAIAGGIAAAITTPFDLAFKRVYTENHNYGGQKWKLLHAIKHISIESGAKGLFAGIKTRVPLISFGSFIFFGCYEEKKRFLFEEN